MECFQESKLKPKSLNWQIGYRLCKRLFIAALPQTLASFWWLAPTIMLSFSGECCGRGFWGFLVKTSRPQVPPTHLWVARDGISYHSSPSCTYIMRNPADEIWRRRRQDKNLTAESGCFCFRHSMRCLKCSFHSCRCPLCFPDTEEAERQD